MMYLGNQAVGIATSLPIFGDKVKIEYGEYTPTEDKDTMDTTIQHSINDVPDFFIYYTKDISVDEIYNVGYVLDGALFPATPQSGKNYNSYVTCRTLTENSTNIGIVRGSLDITTTFTNTTFRFFGPTGSKLKANAKYCYIIGKFKEVTSNA